MRPEFYPPTYLVGVVIAGEGWIQAGSGSLHVRRGETFALPAAALADLVIEAPAGLELIACQPGGPGWDRPQPETSDHATSTETE